MSDPQSHLGVVEMVYHQHSQEQPKNFSSRFGRTLESNDQVYDRKLRATEEWCALDCGWVNDAGMLMLSNEEGKFLQVIPTEEEQRAIDSRVIELSYTQSSNTCWEVPPGESMRAMPSHAASLFVRCRSGTAKFTLCLIPR